MVKNFRIVDGLSGAGRLYRCASIDGLVHYIDQDNSEQSAGPRLVSENIRMLLYEAGLILDLRDPKERDEQAAERWMAKAPGGTFECYQSFDEMAQVFDASKPRVALWLNVLSRQRFRDYIVQNWMPSTIGTISSHPAMVQLLLERDLLGLNQAILEAGKEQICQALQAVTYYWERIPAGVVVVHCVQGKDRTGMLIMLIQSILGVSDDDVIAEYHRSDPSQLEPSSDSLQNNQQQPHPSWMTTSFAEAPRHVMEATLEWLRGKYGSISVYLDGIGFDSTWRHRLIQATSVSFSNEKPVTRNQDSELPKNRGKL